MNKTIIFFFILLLIVLSTAAEYFLPSIWAVPLAAITSFGLGLFLQKKVQQPLKVSFLLLLGMVVVLGLLFLLKLDIHERGHLFSYASILAFGLFAGLFLPKSSFKFKFSFASVFLLGWMAGAGQASFAFVGGLAVSYGAFAVIYGCAGYILQREKVGLYKHLVFLSPQLIVPVLEGLTMSFSWYGKIVIPVIAISAYALGCLASSPRPLFKLPISVFTGGIMLFATFILPGLFQSATWNRLDEKLPAFTLQGLDGDTLKSQELLGKVVWLDIYSSTCRPCIQQMQSVQNVKAKIEGKSNVRFISMASTVFDSYERFLKAEKFHEFPFWHGFDGDTLIARKYAPAGVPVGLLIDQQGKLRYMKEGFNIYEKEAFEIELKQKIENLLKAS